MQDGSWGSYHNCWYSADLTLDISAMNIQGVNGKLFGQLCFGAQWIFLIQNLAPFLQYVALRVVLISLKNKRINKQEILIKHIVRYTHFFNFRFYKFWLLNKEIIDWVTNIQFCHPFLVVYVHIQSALLVMTEFDKIIEDNRRHSNGSQGLYYKQILQPKPLVFAWRMSLSWE